MASTLEQLLNPQSAEQLFALLLSVYQKYGFPTSAWQDFGTDQTRLLAISTALENISSSYIPQITAGGLLGYAENLAAPDWLQLLADENFNTPYLPASHTVGDILLTSASGSGSKTITGGQLIANFGASGNRYINVDGGTLTDGGTLSLSWVAEFPGASYNDGSNSADITLVSPLPGVSLTNPAGDYTDVAHVGAGTGTLTLGGSPTSPHQLTIRIDSSGAAGVASWSYSIDGAPFVSAGATAGPVTLGSTSVTVTLVDGVDGTSFVNDDTYLFNTPGSWITTQGSDLESNANLAQRCRDNWGTLSEIATGSFYQRLAKSTPDVGSQVTQCIVIEDAEINNKVNIVVAGPEGALPPATVALIQTYIDPRAIGTDYPVVQSPSTLDVALVATVTIAAASLAAAEAAIIVAMTDYVNETAINGTLRISKIIELVMDIAGVVDISGVTINGAATNLTLGSSISFVVPSLTLPLSFVYVTA